MNRSPKMPLVLLDALGVGALGAAFVAAVWLTFFHRPHASAELGDLTQMIASGSPDLAALRLAAERQRATLSERQTELAHSGQLPAQIPVEEYFQSLSRLAVAHRLRVIRHHPLAPRSYPGLLEQRYAYEVVGTMPDIARFFKDIEDAEFWADISYLKIDGTQRSGAEPTDQRVASLTISLFSAAPSDAAEGAG